MKKHLSFLLLMISMVKIGRAQNTHLNYNNALKIYNLTTFETQEKSKRISATLASHSTTSHLQILHPSIAFQWKAKKNNFHEIELTNFMVGKSDAKTEIFNDSTRTGQMVEGSSLSTIAISLRYEYLLNLRRAKTRRFVPGIGFGFQPFYTRNHFRPKISSSFPTSDIQFGMKAFFTPRITYFLSSKMFIDVNIPFCVFDSYYSMVKENDPSVPIQERNFNTFNYNQFPKLLSGRIGLGLKL